MTVSKIKQLIDLGPVSLPQKCPRNYKMYVSKTALNDTISNIEKKIEASQNEYGIGTFLVNP